MTKVILILVIRFIICWFPVIGVDFLNAGFDTEKLEGCYVSSILVAGFGSCINPTVRHSVETFIERDHEALVYCTRNGERLHM